jgi:hypothetical protein
MSRKPEERHNNDEYVGDLCVEGKYDNASNEKTGEGEERANVRAMTTSTKS